MTWIENQCDLIWRQVVKEREHETCEICGSHSNIHIHHIIFRSVCPKSLRYVTKLGACLCDKCHQHRDYAPHKDNDKFLEKYLAIIEIKDNNRFQYIKIILETVNEFDTTGIDIKKVHSNLKDEHENIFNTSWMEQDIEPVPGMTVIPESNRIT